MVARDTCECYINIRPSGEIFLGVIGVQRLAVRIAVLLPNTSMSICPRMRLVPPRRHFPNLLLDFGSVLDHFCRLPPLLHALFVSRKSSSSFNSNSNSNLRSYDLIVSDPTGDYMLKKGGIFSKTFWEIISSVYKHIIA